MLSTLLSHWHFTHPPKWQEAKGGVKITLCTDQNPTQTQLL
uniref:Uncharacterized protein n=1 Tax=Rhizophora mucronata TaxID=61149 RepID=A0A2P2J2Z1_RHIMU